jgi:hypothetical protein
MKYVLVETRTGEIDNRVDIASGIGKTGARTYFKGIKRIEGKKFDELWIVMTESEYNTKKLQDNPGYIKWWEDENTNLDIEKE